MFDPEVARRGRSIFGSELGTQGTRPVKEVKVPPAHHISQGLSTHLELQLTKRTKTQTCDGRENEEEDY